MNEKEIKWVLVISDLNAEKELSVFWKTATTEEIKQTMVNMVSANMESRTPYYILPEDIDHTDDINEVQESFDGTGLYAYADFPDGAYVVKAIKSDSLTEFWL